MRDYFSDLTNDYLVRSQVVNNGFSVLASLARNLPITLKLNYLQRLYAELYCESIPGRGYRQGMLIVRRGDVLQEGIVALARDQFKREASQKDRKL